MPDEMEALQRRVSTLERMLAGATFELERVQVRQRRIVRSNRLTMATITAAMAVALLGAARHGQPTAVQQPQVLTVRAPFKVVDGAGRTIMKVSSGAGERGVSVHNDFEGKAIAFLGRVEQSSGLAVYNRGGGILAAISSSTKEGYPPGVFVYNAAEEAVAGLSTSGDEGGVVVAKDQSGEHEVQLKVKDTESGFIMYKGGKPTIQLGHFAKGNAALKIMAGNQVVAGLGESIDGSGGSLVLSDVSGDTRIRAANASGQGGQVIVYGTAGGEAGVATKGGIGSAFAGPPEAPVALLGQSETTAGAGHLALTAPGGGSAVQAGYQGNIGLVVTYAQGKPAGILSPGLKIPGFTAGANW